jgi:hypothetical protein
VPPPSLWHTSQASLAPGPVGRPEHTNEELVGILRGKGVALHGGLEAALLAVPRCVQTLSARQPRVCVGGPARARLCAMVRKSAKGCHLLALRFAHLFLFINTHTFGHPIGLCPASIPLPAIKPAPILCSPRARPA